MFSVSIRIRRTTSPCKLKQRIAEMQQFLAEQRGTIQVYDEQVVRKLIEKITVHDEKVTVAFKSGMEIDVKI